MKKGDVIRQKCVNTTFYLTGILAHKVNNKRYLSLQIRVLVWYRVRNFRIRVTNFNQSEARTRCFLASDWLNFETLPRKFRILLISTNDY